jgi:hypothetical protein
MKLFDAFLFILKYTPFWAVPMGLMSANFAYLYWLKDFREMSYVWWGICLFCLTSIIIYFALGGPDQMIQTFTRTFH